MNALRKSLWTLIALFVVSPLHAQLTSYWRLSENQLDIKQGGRVNSVAVSPFDNHEMYVASETGGLFKSTSAGSHWNHIDGLNVIFTQSVAYVPSQTGVVLVSAKADFKTKNGGGVWRSTDWGVHWTQTLKSTQGQPRLSAYEISVQPGTNTVFVGASNGAYMSLDGGATWSAYPVFSSNFNQTVLSVLATSDRIFFGGPAGLRTADAGLILHTPTISPGSINDMHAFARRGTAEVLAVNGSRSLSISLNGGDQWTPIATAPHGSATCAGTPFVKIADRTTVVDVYFSDRCGLHTLAAPVDNGFPNYFVNDWHDAAIDHGRPRDLAVVGTMPLLLGTTAGLHEMSANVWQLVGGGREGGYNALQINEVKGQIVGQQSADLYVGTQDNGLWASTLGGDIVNDHGSDGHFIELERVAPLGTDSLITFTANNRNQQALRHLTDAQAWPDVPGHRGAPVLVEPCEYLQNSNGSNLFRTRGMAVTEDCGKSWDLFAPFREQVTDIPKIGLFSASIDVVYQSYKNADGTYQLMRIHKVPLDPIPPAIHYPFLGGLGINPTGFGGYQVYAVDPAAALHVIAPDVVNGRMVQSAVHNGVVMWDPVDDLTKKVTDDGNRLFNTDLAGPNGGTAFPIVTAISFCPTSWRLVLVGTNEGGIFVSADNGNTWKAIPGSEKATYITSFYWESPNTVYVSTYGRGLWRLNIRQVAPAEDFDSFCGKCDVVSNDTGAQRPPFDGSALVFGGHVLGVRTDNSRLREIFVTPGSSVIFTGDPNDSNDDVAITERDDRDKTPMEPLPERKDGWTAAGVVFTSDDKLVGTAFAESELSLPTSDTKEDYDVKDSTDSPTAAKPYIQLVTSTSAAVPSAEAEERFELDATDLAAGATYEVLIDGMPLKGELTADSSGSFSTTITAPSDAGYHRVSLRLLGDVTEIGGSTLYVRYAD